MRDLRDPTELGTKLLEIRKSAPHIELSWCADHGALNVRDYVSPEHPHDKYGDPRKLPSTMPNAVE